MKWLAGGVLVMFGIFLGIDAFTVEQLWATIAIAGGFSIFFSD